MSRLWSVVPTLTKVAIVAAILGFVVNFSSTQRTSSPTGRTCSYFDVGALILGGLAIVCGVLGAVGARRANVGANDRTIVWLIAAVAIALGVVHLLRAFGTVGGPC